MSLRFMRFGLFQVESIPLKDIVGVELTGFPFGVPVAACRFRYVRDQREHEFITPFWFNEENLRRLLESAGLTVTLVDSP